LANLAKEFAVVFVAPAAHRDQTLARLKKALRSSFKRLARDAENIKVTAAVGISIYPQPAPSLRPASLRCSALRTKPCMPLKDTIPLLP